VKARLHAVALVELRAARGHERAIYLDAIKSLEADEALRTDPKYQLEPPLDRMRKLPRGELRIVYALVDGELWVLFVGWREAGQERTLYKRVEEHLAGGDYADALPAATTG